MNNTVGCRYFKSNKWAKYNEIFSGEVAKEFYERITNLIDDDVINLNDPVKTYEEILTMIKLLQREKNSYGVSHHSELLSPPINLEEALKKYQELLDEFNTKKSN